MKGILSNRRGQIRVIEAFFASVLLLSSLSMISVVQKNSTTSDGTLSSIALNTLTSLDSDGQLAHLIDNNDWSEMANCLEAVLPPALWFNVTVLDENQMPIDTVPISNGGSPSDHIEAAEYLCASSNATYAIYTIRLQLAGLN